MVLIVDAIETISLDSSMLGNLAARWARGGAERESVENLWDTFVTNGIFPLLSWHHLTELLQHENYGVVLDRIRFLRSRSQLAALKSLSDLPFGSIADLFAFECQVAIRGSAIDLEAVTAGVRNDVFSFASGNELLSPYELMWPELHRLVLSDMARAREIVAITTGQPVDMASTPLSDFMNGRIASPAKSKSILSILERGLAEGVLKHGDRRLAESPEIIASRFYDDVRSLAPRFVAAYSESPSEAMRLFNVSPSEFGPDATFGDFLDLVMFRCRLGLAAEKLEIDASDLYEVSQSAIPSWNMERAIARYGQQRNEHKGSQLNDRHLVCLAPYCLYTYVDKQTQEDVRRAKHFAPHLESAFHGTIKVTYELEKIRSAISGSQT